MPINRDALGDTSEPIRVSWTPSDSLLYAVGVGAGHDPTDPAELPFVTENSIGVPQRALPTMSTVLVDPLTAMGNIGIANLSMLVHGEQSVVVHRELPVAGEIEVVSRVRAIWDKGKGAVIEVTSTATDVSDSSDASERGAVFDAVASIYVRGEGGFGGERGPSSTPFEPAGGPDHVVRQTTRPEQALIYRLSGDRNPLHSDPRFAAMAGFERPILHGLCTYGFAGRALLHSLCSSDPAVLRSMSGRFSSSVVPGEELHTEIWLEEPGRARFRVRAGDGRVVLDAGHCAYAV